MQTMRDYGRAGKLALAQKVQNTGFNQVGYDWEQTVWQTVGTYQVTKKWAFSE